MTTKPLTTFIVIASALFAAALLIYRLLLDANYITTKQAIYLLAHNEVPHAIIIFAVTINSFFWAKIFRCHARTAWLLAIVTPIFVAVAIELFQGWQATEALYDLLRGCYGLIPGLLFNCILSR